jgi:hypothetical protein
VSDKTLRELQTTLPWTIKYSRDYRADPRPHKDFTHALLHVGKALGHLQGLADDMDHDREIANDPTLRDRFGKYLADLVVCALRAANVFPGGVVDLQTATEERIRAKNAPPQLDHAKDCNCYACEGQRKVEAAPRVCGFACEGRHCQLMPKHAGPHLDHTWEKGGWAEWWPCFRATARDGGRCILHQGHDGDHQTRLGSFAYTDAMGPR